MRRRTYRLRGGHEVGRVVCIRFLPSQIEAIRNADMAEWRSRGFYDTEPNVSQFVRRAALQAASAVLRPAGQVAGERNTFDGRRRRGGT